MSQRRSGRRRRPKGADAPEVRVPDHPLICAAPPEIISTPDDLEAFVDHVREHEVFAYDTEFVGEESYHPQLCLIQLATTERVAVVDPLDGLAVTSIWQLIADPSVETVVHAGEQDLEPVVRHIDCDPANVFDTQVAAGFTNRPFPLGLHRLIVELLGVRLPKGLTYTQWDHRPLSARHARYAADDVRFLLAARDELVRDLDQRGHEGWARAECDRLSLKQRFTSTGETRFAKLVGNRNLRPRDAARLRELVHLRDELARQQDVPPRTLLRDNVLSAVAKSRPATVDDLAMVKGFPRPLARDHGEAILESMRRVEALDRADLPETDDTDESPADQVRIDSLWSLISTYCLGRGIAPSVVTNRREVARLYRAVRGGANGSALGIMSGWRKELVGDLVTSMIAGGSELRLSWLDDALVATVHEQGPPPRPT